MPATSFKVIEALRTNMLFLLILNSLPHPGSSTEIQGQMQAVASKLALLTSHLGRGSLPFAAVFFRSWQFRQHSLGASRAGERHLPVFFQG